MVRIVKYISSIGSDADLKRGHKFSKKANVILKRWLY
jgi:hypothetical protein